MNIFDLSLKLKGFPIRDARKKLREIQSIEPALFANYIDRSRWEIFKYHSENNRFYIDFIKESKIECWEDIPIIRKSDMQGGLEKRLSNNFTVKNVYRNNTS